MEIGALSDEEELLARRKFFQRLVLDSDEPSIVKLQPELANLSLSLSRSALFMQRACQLIFFLAKLNFPSDYKFCLLNGIVRSPQLRQWRREEKLFN
jgi:hypothetical protein